MIFSQVSSTAVLRDYAMDRYTPDPLVSCFRSITLGTEPPYVIVDSKLLLFSKLLSLAQIEICCIVCLAIAP